ncbi:kinase-like domain-containing protein [Sporodiniella umbellata]|nr:kinase-like domain-containing protein [Sporodiniella umbellata]
MNCSRKLGAFEEPRLSINTDSLGISFTKQAKHPFPSPPSTSPYWRSQCQLTRSSNSSPTKVTSKSWESMRSPAASFLAGFAMPTVDTLEQEQEGDEIDDYVLDKVIGYGGFSVVRKGFRISDGKKVAIKIIRKHGGDDDSRLDRELNIWRSLSHDHLVALEKVLETDHAVFVICEYCDNGNLIDLLKKPIAESEARRIFLQLADALRYLHQDARICHKDIKLENVLLDEKNNVKLCDFGLAVCQQPLVQLPMSPPLEHSSDIIAGGSLPYAAPEQVNSPLAIGCPSTDVWSLGVVLYALVVGKLPFADDYEPRLHQKILTGEYYMPPSLPLDLQQLISHCLCLDPHQRHDISQLLLSPWLNG